MRELLWAASCAWILAALSPALAHGQSPLLRQSAAAVTENHRLDWSQQPAPSESSSGEITGRERLAWDQQAPDAAALAQYSFVLYVDGLPVVLPEAACGALAGEGPSAACSSPLPVLAAGQHTLEMATRIAEGGAVVESARSAPLVVTVAATGAVESSSLGGQAAGVKGLDAEPYVIEPVAQGLERPSALAKLPDGRLLIAERRGRVLIADDDGLAAEPTAQLADADVGADEGWSLVVAPDFAKTRHVYVSYIALDAEGSRTGRVVRFREVGGILGEAAVVVDGLPAQSGTLKTRIGPDGALYVGTTAFDPRDADDLGSYAGKILRFTTTGAAPSDNPVRFSPVFSSGYRGRLDFDWDPAKKSLWGTEADPTGMSLVSIEAGRPGRGVLRLDELQAAGVAFHVGAAPAAWRGSLFLASPDQGCLYRVAGLASSPLEPSIERLLANRFGRIVAVLSGDDGLYFATGNGGTDERGRPADAVFRIRDKSEPTGLPAKRNP